MAPFANINKAFGYESNSTLVLRFLYPTEIQPLHFSALHVLFGVNDQTNPEDCIPYARQSAVLPETAYHASSPLGKLD